MGQNESPRCVQTETGVPQLRPWSPVASVDAYSKVVRYDGIIAETVKAWLDEERPCEVQILTRI